MMTMTAISVAGLWVTGGALFIHGAVTNPHASPGVTESSRGALDGLIRFELAALVALALFVAVWPAVFIGAHLGKMRGGR